MNQKKLNQRQKRRILKNKATKIDQQRDQTDGDLQQAIILASYGKTAAITLDLNADSPTFIGRPRQNVGALVSGDRVLVQFHEDDAAQSDSNQPVITIEARLPRQNALSRATARNITRSTTNHASPKAVAANIDRLFIVIAPEPTPSFLQIDQYLLSATQLNIDTAIIINKVDLLARDGQQNDEAHRLINQITSLYQALGYPILSTHTRSTTGLQPLIDHIKAVTQRSDDHNGQTDAIGVLFGESGVGKSSLTRALLPNDTSHGQIAVGPLSKQTGRGQHTTTTSMLYPIQGKLNFAIIDCPGMRDFLPPQLDINQLSQGFKEIDEIAPYCRFRNCSHRHEPNCAVQKAVEQGDIARVRLENFHYFLDTLSPPG